MEAAVFKALLRFVYTDTVPEFDEQEKEPRRWHPRWRWRSIC
jgi:hypothetical protein